MIKYFPENWKIVELKYIFEIKKGKKVNITDNKNNESIPYVGIRNLRGTPISQYSSDKNGLMCEKNDLLLVWDGANCGTVGTGLSGYVGSTIARLRLNDSSVSVDYACRFLKSKFKYFNSTTTGTTIPHLDKKKVHGLKIPLPPLPTQKKIAAILEKAEKLKRWRAEADKLTDEFLKSTFLEMFGEPIKNNKNWKIKTIEDFSSQIIDCPHSTPKHIEYITDFPCIRTTELKDGYIDWKQMKYLDEEEYEKRVKRLVPVEGDIIYGREGSFGQAVRIPANTKISLGQRVMLFRPKSEVCNSEFFWALLNSDSIYFQALKKTNGSTVGHVNIKDIKKFKCICPPLPLQQKFASIVQQVEHMRQYQQQSKAHIGDLFNALMQKAFKGELVA